MEKRCFKCHQDKSLDSFYRHSAMKDGRLNKCIECAKRDAAANRDSNIERYRQHDRQRAGRIERRLARRSYEKTDAGKVARKVASENYNKRHPGKRQAHILVGNALRDGRLERKPCEVCGTRLADAHHDDYSKPLEVRWLCVVHHKRFHAEAAIVNAHANVPF